MKFKYLKTNWTQIKLWLLSSHKDNWSLYIYIYLNKNRSCVIYIILIWQMMWNTMWSTAEEKRKNICVVYSRFHLLLPVPYVFALSVLRSLFFFFLLFQIFMYNLLFFSLIRWRVNGICSLINHQRPTAELRRWWWWQGHRDISANNHHFKLRSNIHAYIYILHINRQGEWTSSSIEYTKESINFAHSIYIYIYNISVDSSPSFSFFSFSLFFLVYTCRYVVLAYRTIIHLICLERS
jgi:hypothetical protein